MGIITYIKTKKVGVIGRKMKELVENKSENTENKRLSYLREILRDRNIRISKQRLLILDYLMTHPIHPTAEEIFNGLKSEDPVISQATVYNTLNLFVKLKLIKELDFNMTSKRYEFNKSSHGHFICESCGMIKDLDSIEIEKPEKLRGYNLDDVELIYRGICPDCKR